MAVKVVSELTLDDEYGIEEFLDLWVVSLGVKESFADEVHRPLSFEGVALFLSLHHHGRTDGVRGGRVYKSKVSPSKGEASTDGVVRKLFRQSRAY